MPGSTFTLIGSSTLCDKRGCLREAPFVDGAYTIAGQASKLLRAPGVTKEKVERFRDIAQAVQAGEKTKQEATSEVRDLNAAFLILWKLCGSPQMALLVAVLSILLTIMFEQADEETSVQQHRDAQHLIQTQERIYEELKKQNATDPTPGMPQHPNQVATQASPEPKPLKDAVSRQQRRRADQIAQKRDRRP